MIIANLLSSLGGTIAAFHHAWPLSASAPEADAGPTRCPSCGDPACDSKRVLQNAYVCSMCGTEWWDSWCCGCDDECPACGAHMSPTHSIEEQQPD